MKLKFLLIPLMAFCLFFGCQISVFAEDEHQHVNEESSKEHHDHENKGHTDDHTKDDHADGDNDDEHGEEGEESTGGVGPNNAVTAADEHKGIQLSAKAQKAIGLKSESYQNGNVPLSALVRHQNQISVYRLRDGWYKLVSVRVEKIENGQAVVRTDEMSPGDLVVVQSVALLRVAELDAFSGEVGHSH